MKIRNHVNHQWCPQQLKMVFALFDRVLVMLLIPYLHKNNRLRISLQLERRTVNVSHLLPSMRHKHKYLSLNLFQFAAAIDYLNEPANGIHRAGAIAVGALSGYIIGIRRGFIRRLLYTSAGGLGVASICYPKEAAVYSQQALTEAKVYATILYNFAYGGLCLISFCPQLSKLIGELII